MTSFMLLYVWLPTSSNQVCYSLGPSKQESKATDHLLDICNTFDVPMFFQCDMGHGFCISVTEELIIMWNDLKIFHGIAKVKSQLKVNQDIENILCTWIQANFSIIGHED
jgi:hypothetical protein